MVDTVHANLSYLPSKVISAIMFTTYQGLIIEKAIA